LAYARGGFLWKHDGMSVTLILASLLSGAFIGAVLGFIGAGGAMITVPILIYIFDFTPLQATTAALAVVFLAAFASLLPKFKSNDVLFKEAITIWSLGLITNIGLGSIADSIPVANYLNWILHGISWRRHFHACVHQLRISPEKRFHLST
jgi:uncharacterized membrane protein YfcA